MENPIFHTQDLCLRTLDTNLMCKSQKFSHYAKKKCAEMRSNMVLIAGVIGIVVIAVVVVVAAVVAVTAGVKDTLKDDE